jgi:hypothetical protein
MDLYSMPSMSDNHHLKLALHLTDCKSSAQNSAKNFLENQPDQLQFYEI